MVLELAWMTIGVFHFEHAIILFDFEVSSAHDVDEILFKYY